MTTDDPSSPARGIPEARAPNGAIIFDDSKLVVAAGKFVGPSYRYLLWRTLPPVPFLEPNRARVLWVMLNPSTADAEKNDPTLRKVIGFSYRWGYQLIEVVNLYALRSTDPNGLDTPHNARGAHNDAYIERAVDNADEIVFAWGGQTFPKGRGQDIDRRAADVVRLVTDRNRGRNTKVVCLGYTAAGRPRHPLMLAYATPREAYAHRVPA